MAAKDAATHAPARSLRGRRSVAFLRRKIGEKMKERWIADTEARMTRVKGERETGVVGENGGKKRGAFKGPDRRRGPRIREPLRRARKRTASIFYQMLSGHAMIAPFLKEKWGWIDTDQCWWCRGGRQSRDHLFKECTTWKREIRELWNEVGRISGERGKEGSGDPHKSRKGFGFQVRQARARPSNTTVRELLSDEKYSRAVLEFLDKTRVGEVKEGIICK